MVNIGGADDSTGCTRSRKPHQNGSGDNEQTVTVAMLIPDSLYQIPDILTGGMTRKRTPSDAKR